MDLSSFIIMFPTGHGDGKNKEKEKERWEEISLSMLWSYHTTLLYSQTFRPTQETLRSFAKLSLWDGRKTIFASKREFSWGNAILVHENVEAIFPFHIFSPITMSHLGLHSFLPFTMKKDMSNKLTQSTLFYMSRIKSLCLH